ncbi:MAG: transporter [Rhodanobacter sp.]|jgi:hypothetical protein|nr:transporter [Rhodanobacter sp.]
MKKKVLCATLTMVCMSWACQSMAEELWDPQPRGINIGLPAGALPPPGVYGVLDNYWASFDAYDHTGKVVPGTGLQALVEVPILLWVPGVQVLGGDYALGIAQPFDYTSSGGISGHSGSGNWGLYNTLLIPAQVAWKMPNDVFVKAGLIVGLDTASTTMPDLLSGRLTNGGLPSGNGYYSVQPTLGISWLHDGWNLSADLNYCIPVSKSTGHWMSGSVPVNYSYKSAPEFMADYTVAKTVGKWTFGLGVHHQEQFTSDKLNGVTVPHSRAVNIGLGPLVEYQFAGLSILAEYNRDVHVKNDVGGNFFNFRLVVPL